MNEYQTIHETNMTSVAWKTQSLQHGTHVTWRCTRVETKGGRIGSGWVGGLERVKESVILHTVPRYWNA